MYAASNMTNRFDGNGFPALLLEAQENTEWRSGAGPFVIGANLTVPSFLNPAKTDSSVEDRSEKEYVKAGYGMLFDFDYLPTQFGSALAMGGPAGLLLFTAAAGLCFALFDRFLRKRTEARLVLGLVVAEAIIANYESDISSWPVALRSAALFLAVIGIGTLVRGLLRMRAVDVDRDDEWVGNPVASRGPKRPTSGQRSPKHKVRHTSKEPVEAKPLGFDPFEGDERELARIGADDG